MKDELPVVENSTEQEVVPLDSLLDIIPEYTSLQDELAKVGFTNQMHDQGPRPGVNEDTWNNWRGDFPRFPDEEVEALNQAKERVKERIFSLLGITEPDLQESVLIACDFIERTKRGGEKDDVPNAVRPVDLTVDFENDWYKALQGLIAVAQKTGETFNFYQAPYGPGYFPVTAETVCPKFRERYDPEHWPELRDIHFNLDRYVRDFYPDRYAAKDPTLIEHYQGMIERLQRCHKQPMVTINQYNDSMGFYVGLVEETSFNEVSHDGDRSIMVVGKIMVNAFATQWAVTSLEDHAKPVLELSKMYAEYTRGIMRVESLWMQGDELVDTVEGPTILLIGNDEIQEYLDEHPEDMPIIDGMLKNYQNPNLGYPYK